MSGHNKGPGPRLHHTGHPAIRAAAAAANLYVPLPSQVQQLATTMLQQVTGPNGTHFLG
jgi:hypothetical protein